MIKLLAFCLLAAFAAPVVRGETASAPLPPDCTAAIIRIERALPAVKTAVARLPPNSLSAAHAAAARAWIAARIGELTAQAQWDTSLFPRISQELGWMDELASTIAAGTNLLAYNVERQLPARFTGATASGAPVSFDYVIHLPKGFTTAVKWPLIVFLHGYTSEPSIRGAMREYDAVAASAPFPFITVAPVLPLDREHAGGWEPDEVIALLDAIVSTYPVDTGRIYLTGFSMGGMGTWKTAMQYPGRFAAIAPVCGSGDQTLLYRVKNLPVWMFHGDRDTAVPFYSSVRMKTGLERLGAHPLLTVYTNVGHNAWDPAYRDPRLYAWMLKHSRATLAPPPPLATPQMTRNGYTLDGLCVADAPQRSLLCAAESNSFYQMTQSIDETRTRINLSYFVGQPYGIDGDVTIALPKGCDAAALGTPPIMGIPVTSNRVNKKGYALTSLSSARCVSAVYTGPLSLSCLADAESVLDDYAAQHKLTPNAWTRIVISYFSWRGNTGTFIIQRLCK